MSLKDLMPKRIKNYIHRLQSYYANVKYNFPAENLKIIGVTGTDGKTTTATMIYEILKQAGYKVGLITTVSAKIGKKEFDTGFHVTTPDPWDIPRYMSMMLDAGMKWVVLEVTSHGLDQNRIAYMTFKKAVFTNITHEHLDYHKTWKAYAQAKAKLLTMVKEGDEVIYKEDERGGKFLKKMIKRNPEVLLEKVCNDQMAKKKEVTREGIEFLYDYKGEDIKIEIPILGEYNIGNTLCAIKACESLAEKEDIIEALKNFKGIKGRMQIMRRNRPCLIIVDFAHTPNALEKALMTVKKFKGKGRVIVVFGCAGLRDSRKRKKMGRISAKYADIIVITSEDPRTENLSKINDQVLKGAIRSKSVLVKRFKNRKAFRKSKISGFPIDELINNEKKPIFVFDEPKVNSREDAIEFAVKIAQKEDIVIITGKGHEKSMCFGQQEYSWSDFEAVRRAVKQRYKKFL